MAGLLLRAVAGGLKGYGEGLTAQHGASEARKGEALRQAYEDQRQERVLANRTETANIGARATLAAGQERSDTARYVADLGAQGAAARLTAATEADAAGAEAAGDAATTERDDRLMEQLATVIDEQTGEQTLDTGLLQGLRAGREKFGKVPPLEDVRVYIASSPVPSRRKWPSELSYSWDDIAKMATDPGMSVEEMAEAAVSARDRLSSMGIEVPRGAPPAAAKPPESTSTKPPGGSFDSLLDDIRSMLGGGGEPRETRAGGRGL